MAITRSVTTRGAVVVAGERFRACSIPPYPGLPRTTVRRTRKP